MIASHALNALKAGWWILVLFAIANGVPSYEYSPFLLLSSAIMHAIDVTWWMQGWTLTRQDVIGAPGGGGDVEGGGGGASTTTTKPEAVFAWWVRNFLKEDPNGKVSGGEAYENYAANCRANWHQPESSSTFGVWLTDLAVNSGGTIKKIKASSNYYQGWTLVGGGDHGAVEAEIT